MNKFCLPAKVDKVKYDIELKTYIIGIKALEINKIFELIINKNEAEFVVHALDKVLFRNPSIYETIINLIHFIDVKLINTSVIIEKKFVYGSLRVSSIQNEEISINCSPVDAIVIGLLSNSDFLLSYNSNYNKFYCDNSSSFNFSQSFQSIDSSRDLNYLKNILKKAIDLENYEFAAVLRDKIKNIDL
tara:strand:- start:391 stop:954 length:564 start_codon:yes stop_codon:yes gene_type:complete